MHAGIEAALGLNKKQPLKTRILFTLFIGGWLSGQISGTVRAETTNPINPYTQEPPAQHDARMKWFREARFGMFIHWGLYSQAAGELEKNSNTAKN